jgi:hypothetical protein
MSRCCTETSCNEIARRLGCMPPRLDPLDEDGRPANHGVYDLAKKLRSQALRRSREDFLCLAPIASPRSAPRGVPDDRAGCRMWHRAKNHFPRSGNPGNPHAMHPRTAHGAGEATAQQHAESHVRHRDGGVPAKVGIWTGQVPTRSAGAGPGLLPAQVETSCTSCLHAVMASTLRALGARPRPMGFTAPVHEES